MQRDVVAISQNVCCFIGHRRIDATDELRTRLFETVENLILNKRVDTFLFGSQSDFNDLCHTVVTEIQKTYPYVKRVFVRGEFPFIDDSYRNYLLRSYEKTYFPEKIMGAGRAVYIKRNQEMIDKSDFCIFYCKDDYSPKGRRSGTKIAYEYALKRHKIIYRFPLISE